MQLLERNRALDVLASCVKTAKTQGGIVLVAGEAGIGKTSLVQEFAAGQRELRALWGACDALFTPRPFAPVYDIARQTGGALSTLLRAGTDRDAIFNAVLDELEKTPSLVAFEDLHWGDEATLDLLKMLGRRIQRTHSILIVTYRDDEVGPRHPLRIVIGDLPRDAVTRLSLAPLSETAVAALAREAGRSPIGLHALTGGNPLFVTELLAAGTDSVPLSVSDAVLARASRLSEKARALAELVSVVPARTEDWLVASLQPDDATIESCLAMGIVRHDDRSLSFRHELTRRALQDSLLSSRQQALHAQVLASLKRRTDISAARLAHHADGAVDEAAVIEFAPRAAREATAVAAHREAVSHYALALRYARGLNSIARAELLEQLSYECYLTEQNEQAIEARHEALDLWRKAGDRYREGSTLRWLSRLSWFSGRRADADQYADAAIAILETLPHGDELAMAYSNRAQLDMLATQSESAKVWATRAITLAESLGNAEILSHALNNLGMARVDLGEQGGWDDLDRSLRLALDHKAQEHAARAYTNLASLAVKVRDYETATRWLREGMEYCERYDLDSWLTYMRVWRARACFEQGDWNTAGEEADHVVRGAHTAPIRRISAMVLLGNVRLRRGDPQAHAQLLEASRLIAPLDELQHTSLIAAALAEAAWLVGDHEQIVRVVSPAFELALSTRDAWARGELAVWLWRVNALSSVPDEVALPYASELAGDWQGAAQQWAKYGCPYEQAFVLGWHGDAEAQRKALAIFDRLGAVPAAAALRQHLRSQGTRGIPRGARRTTRANEYGLTKREAQILALLPERLSNAAIAKRLFLSTKTVDHHVSSILGKLGVTSRAEAGDIARETSGPRSLSE